MTELLQPTSDVPGKVRRSKDGRPYVKQTCPDRHLHIIDMLNLDGFRVVGKRPGTTKQCPKCKGKGYVEKLYTRCTSFVGVLEDKSTVEKWRLRVTLTGLRLDDSLITELTVTEPDERERLDEIAEQAFTAGDGYVKAQKGTDLHLLTEYVDKGWDLPASLTDFETGQERPVTLQDRADLAAWLRVKENLSWFSVAMECFVVQDDYEIGGTYDRLGMPSPPTNPCSECPDHTPMILDLKTGRIDYGAGKMAQQLAVYANSRDYDPETGERSDQDVCTHFGLVVHLPQGTGEATVHVVDLVAGWADVKLSDQVRNHRREQKFRMWPLDQHQEQTA